MMTPERPGVLLYREVYMCIQQLTDQEAGALIRAVLEYAFDGVVPSLSKDLSLVWSLLQPSIDRDGERYTTKVLRARYAVASRERKRHELPHLTYEEWLVSVDTDG